MDNSLNSRTIVASGGGSAGYNSYIEYHGGIGGAGGGSSYISGHTGNGYAKITYLGK